MTDIYRTIMTAAAEQCGLTYEQIATRQGRGAGKHDASTARYIGWYVLSTHYGWSYAQICRHAVLFTHPTIRRGIMRIGEMPSTSSIGEAVARIIDSV